MLACEGVLMETVGVRRLCFACVSIGMAWCVRPPSVENVKLTDSPKNVGGFIKNDDFYWNFKAECWCWTVT